MIDVYCERVDAGFWAEPLNALTNLSFIVAAAFAWNLASKRRLLGPDVVLLITLVLSIGIGSFLFHTFATRWAMAADVIPILLFQLAYLWTYGARIIGLRVPGRALAIAALLAGFYISAHFIELMNGSLSYLPAFLTLLALGIYHYRHAAVARRLLLTASALLAVSLAFRTIDQSVCDQVAVGTHLLWHLLNGLVLYLVMRALLMNLRPAGRHADLH
jgi:hypothetical protein